MNRQAVADRLRAAGCVFAEDEARLLLAHASSPAETERLVAARVEGHPLETLLGWVDFAGLRLRVGPGVFVPRRRTELLARLAVAYAGPGSTMVELCCGVAPVAAVVLDRGRTERVLATDIDPVACSYAGENVGVDRVVRGDLFDALPVGWRGSIDVLAGNAPYVPTDRIAFMPPEAREHEPRHTLDGGIDGTDLHRRIAAGAGGWLSPGGVVLIETGRDQATATARLLAETGLEPRVHTDDDVDATVVEGRLRASYS